MITSIIYSSNTYEARQYDAKFGGSSSSEHKRLNRVYFGSETNSLTIKEIQQRKSYQELIAEIGGWLGLLVGASVVTVLEISSLALDLAKFLWRKRKHVSAYQSS